MTGVHDPSVPVPPPDSHYQLQGTWTTATGRSINYLLLKESLDSALDISRVYFNVEDVRGCEGSAVAGEDVTDRLHISLVNLILEFPTSEIVCDLFRDFLAGLQPLASVLVSARLCRSRLVHSSVPKVQLKVESSQELASDGEEEEAWRTEPRLGVDEDDQNNDLRDNVMPTSGVSKSQKRKSAFPAPHSSKARGVLPGDDHGIPRKKPPIERRPASLVCPTCGEKKHSEHNLAQHVRKFHEDAFPEPIVCQLCADTKQLRNRKYHTPYSFELHMKQIHRFVTTVRHFNCDAGGFVFLSQMIGMHTSLQSACLIILFIHCSGGAEGKVVCEYCCKEFIGSIGKVRFALREHVAAVHLGIRKSCDECGKTFVSNIVLNKHKKHVHRREGSYPCRVCGKVFRYSQQAIDHAYKDRGLAPYECSACPFRTGDNWALAKHKRVCPALPREAEDNVLPALNLVL